jgi:hypothetical protein
MDSGPCFIWILSLRKSWKAPFCSHFLIMIISWPFWSESLNLSSPPSPTPTQKKTPSHSEIFHGKFGISIIMSCVVVIGIMCWRRCQNQNLGHHVFFLWGLQLVSIFWILSCVFCSFVLLLGQKHTWKKKTMEAVGTTQDFKEFEIWKTASPPLSLPI